MPRALCEVPRANTHFFTAFPHHWQINTATIAERHTFPLLADQPIVARIFIRFNVLLCYPWSVSVMIALVLETGDIGHHAALRWRVLS
jgi:hypothetical protein